MRFTRSLTVLPALLILATLGANAQAKKIKAPAPKLEVYSAYDPAQDPDADQSSTFQEPELFEAYVASLPSAPAKESAPVQALPSAKRVTQLPDAAKAAPKVTVRKVEATKVAETAPRPVAPPAPVNQAPAPELASLKTAVEKARYASPASPRRMPEREYLTQACEGWRGIKDYPLADGNTADCVTMRNALAVAYADAWVGAANRAVSASRLTGLPAAVALIIENESDLGHLQEILRYREKHRLPFEVKKVMLPELRDQLAI